MRMVSDVSTGLENARHPTGIWASYIGLGMFAGLVEFGGSLLVPLGHFRLPRNIEAQVGVCAFRALQRPRLGLASSSCSPSWHRIRVNFGWLGSSEGSLNETGG